MPITPYHAMRLLHTSDWHLGRALYGKQRYPEFAAFLDWLLDIIVQERVEALLVAGDVFDSALPGSRAQELYYRFLGRLARGSCRHAVIIAGNHDSPGLLEAPQDLLAALNVHVVGRVTDNPEDEIRVLSDPEGRPELVVCAVPHLRDQDIRRSAAGESADDKEARLLRGIAEHFQTVFARAEALRDELRSGTGQPPPIVALGHLFAAGGSVRENEGERELYVGSLARVPASVFPRSLAYAALGHLHSPQRIDDDERIRYSGAPLAMSFDEGPAKNVFLVDCETDGDNNRLTVRPLAVPTWQRLARVRGDWPEIAAQLNALAAENKSLWLEVEYTGAEILGDFRARLEVAVAGTQLEVLRARNRQLATHALAPALPGEELVSLDAHEVFARCLEARNIPEEQRPGLVAAYREIVQELADEDRLAE